MEDAEFQFLDLWNNY